jgi:hypothetical protein
MHADDSVKVGLKRGMKASQQTEQGPYLYVPSSKHPSIKLKKKASTVPDDNDDEAEEIPTPIQSDADKEETEKDESSK